MGTSTSQPQRSWSFLLQYYSESFIFHELFFLFFFSFFLKTFNARYLTCVCPYICRCFCAYEPRDTGSSFSSYIISWNVLSLYIPKADLIVVKKNYLLHFRWEHDYLSLLTLICTVFCSSQIALLSMKRSVSSPWSYSWNKVIYIAPRASLFGLLFLTPATAVQQELIQIITQNGECLPLYLISVWYQTEVVQTGNRRVEILPDQAYLYGTDSS